MRPGPKKQPTAIRLLRGNPSKERIKTSEPKPPAGVPTKPAALSVDAAAVWDATIALLSGIPGLLTVADGATVELFARTFARYRALEATIETHGPVVEFYDNGGAVKYAQIRPEAGLSAKLLPQLRGLAAELGLNPSARTRIDLPAAPVVDELTAFLAKGRA